MHLMLIAAWYSPANWPYIAMALLALGFVIFVHELGHFLVAKLCGVKCEKFFVGFDVPIKLGWGKFAIQLPSAFWRKTWGETEYGIGIIPLGGYVKMLGQDDNPGRQAEMMREAREQAEAGEPGGEAEATEENFILDPRSYMAQTVPERMAIISAGVVMNIIFALIFAVIAFGIGAPYTKCLVGFVTPGQAAWYNNVRPGNDIVKIGDIENPRFKDMRQEVILGDTAQGIPLVVRRKNEQGEIEDVDFVLKPRADSVARYNVPILGVSPTSTLELAAQNVALPNSPAAAIDSRLEGSETIVEVDGQPVETFAEYMTLLARKADQEIAVTLVKKPAKESAIAAESAVKTIERVTVNVAANRLRRFGLVMAISAITAVQPGSPAAEAGLQVDDKLVAIDGQPVGDPLLLPAYFRRRAGQSVEIELLRPSQGGNDKKSVRVVVTPRPPEWYAVLRETMEVPALGIVYDVSPEVAAIVPESPAAASEIRVGDQIIKAKLIPAGDEQKQLELEVFGSLSAFPIGGKTGSSWPGFLGVIQSTQADTAIQFTVRRGDEQLEVQLVPEVDENSIYAERGFVFMPEKGVLKAKSFGEAISLGWRETKYAMLTVYRFLHKLLAGQLSPKLLGGPGTIAAVAGITAKEGISSLLIFLTLLSANLAVVNFLPIPVLDGGHMVFLIFEAVFRRPVSEKIVIPLTYAGLALILCLMAFVIGLDVNRFIFGG